MFLLLPLQHQHLTPAAQLPLSAQVAQQQLSEIQQLPPMAARLPMSYDS
jgi:hypothetical protein